MEDALVLNKMLKYQSMEEIVLILVLMEDALVLCEVVFTSPQEGES